MATDFFKETEEVVSKDMFANGVGTIFETISSAGTFSVSPCKTFSLIRTALY